MKVVIFGASGRTGVELVKQALDAGHSVTAYVRNPAKVDIQHEQLRVLQGDFTDAEKVGQAVAGQDAVLNTLGPTSKESVGILSQGIQFILEAMQKHGVRRYIAMAGGSLPTPGDPPSVGTKIMRAILKLVSGKIIAESERMARLAEASDRDYTIVRAPFLTNGPLTGTYRTGAVKLGLATGISRADAAHFILRELAENAYIRQAPRICR